MKKAQKRIDAALARLGDLGIKVNSYTVYPGQGSVKANVTIEIKHESKGPEDMRGLSGSVPRKAV